MPAKRNALYRFWGNPFVQGVGVFIALAVAFSGKLDANGTVTAIVLAGIVGAIGLYAQVRNKIVSIVLIVAYGCGLWAFNDYLTKKPDYAPFSAVYNEYRLRLGRPVSEAMGLPGRAYQGKFEHAVHIWTTVKAYVLWNGEQAGGRWEELTESGFPPDPDNTWSVG